MGFPPTRRPIALSIVLCASCIVAAAAIRDLGEGAFVASSSNSRARPMSYSSFSPRRTMSAAAVDDDDDDDDAELPPAGSFFYEVPPNPREKSTSDDDDVVAVEMGDAASTGVEISSSSAGFLLGGEDDGGNMEMFRQILQSTRISGGGGGGGRGFARTTSTTDHATRSVIQTTDKSKGSFVGIGRPLNDVRNPEYDENGYTLYADETTGEKRRVFEALVEYPSVFKMKIVGRDEADEGAFAPEMVRLVARSCGVDTSMVKHTERKNGKWTSVTVHAPVRDADMLYGLYESVDKDPRVKFKF